MSRMTRDNWLVYAIFREIDGKAKAETYRHKVNAKNAEYGINGDGEKNPWSTVKGDFDGYIEKRFIPYHVSKTEAEEIAGETWIEPTYSAYDCTGRPFSASIDFYDVPGGTWIYHHVGYDF